MLMKEREEKQYHDEVVSEHERSEQKLAKREIGVWDGPGKGCGMKAGQKFWKWLHSLLQTLSLFTELISVFLRSATHPTSTPSLLSLSPAANRSINRFSGPREELLLPVNWDTNRQSGRDSDVWKRAQHPSRWESVRANRSNFLPKPSPFPLLSIRSLLELIYFTIVFFLSAVVAVVVFPAYCVTRRIVMQKWTYGKDTFLRDITHMLFTKIPGTNIYISVELCACCVLDVAYAVSQLDACLQLLKSQSKNNWVSLWVTLLPETEREREAWVKREKSSKNLKSVTLTRRHGVSCSKNKKRRRDGREQKRIRIRRGPTKGTKADSRIASEWGTRG